MKFVGTQMYLFLSLHYPNHKRHSYHRNRYTDHNIRCERFTEHPCTYKDGGYRLKTPKTEALIAYFTELFHFHLSLEIHYPIRHIPKYLFRNGFFDTSIIEGCDGSTMLEKMIQRIVLFNKVLIVMW